MHQSKLVRVLVAGAATVGLIAATAPLASGAGGDNAGPAVVAPAGHEPDIAKNDFFAVVNADGTLARGKKVVSVDHTAGSGAYIVFFKKNVRNCVYTASIGLGGDSGTSARGFITTVGAAAGETGVFITTDDIAGNPAERGFHLYVGC